MFLGFPGGAVGKESVCNTGDARDPRSLPLGQEDPLEEEMATRSTILVWIIPRTEEPGGIESMGSQ